MPLTMGRRIFSSVHTAPTAIAPAPTNRTSLANALDTTSATGSPVAKSPMVRIGNITPTEMTIPTSIAKPTAIPTRCPTPINASDRLAPNSEPPAPTRKYVAIEFASTLRLASSANPADTRAPRVMIRRPVRLSAAPSLRSPTLSTSAAATPSG